VAPNEKSGQAAFASNVSQMPENLRLYLPDPEGEDSYPIVSLTWLLLYERHPDKQKSAALKRFVTWGLSQGQSFGPDLGYITLPAAVRRRSRAALERFQSPRLPVPMSRRTTRRAGASICERSRRPCGACRQSSRRSTGP